VGTPVQFDSRNAMHCRGFRRLVEIWEPRSYLICVIDKCSEAYVFIRRAGMRLLHRRLV